MFIFTLMGIDLIQQEWDCTLEGRSKDMYASIYLYEYNGKINFQKLSDV
jgi:(p)ppGpp synthase/HD superfamily hydrolase